MSKKRSERRRGAILAAIGLGILGHTQGWWQITEQNILVITSLILITKGLIGIIGLNHQH